MEKLEVIGLLSGTEGGAVDPKGKIGHWSARMKQEGEMEVDGEMHQEESAKIQSPNGKVIRVEPEETQDYVRETLAISQEEAEEIGLRAKCPW